VIRNASDVELHLAAKWAFVRFWHANPGLDRQAGRGGPSPAGAVPFGGLAALQLAGNPRDLLMETKARMFAA
jgi:hypothetical protein